MKPIRYYCLVVLFVLSLASLASKPVVAQDAPLTGEQIFAKSEAAYDALTSYSCHVDASATGPNGLYMTATADIQFVRPGQLSAAGTSLFKTPYAFVTNGTARSVTANGSTGSATSDDYGLASVTGLGGTAPATVSALLLHTKWGWPFAPGQIISNSITMSNVNGVPCCEVDILSPIKKAFWFDPHTFLITQIAMKMTMGSLGTYHYLQTISNAQVNPTIPASVFVIAGQ